MNFTNSSAESTDRKENPCSTCGTNPDYVAYSSMILVTMLPEFEVIRSM